MSRANASPNRQQHFVFQSSQLFDLYALETKSVAYVLQGAGMNPLALMTCQVIRQEIFPPQGKREIRRIRTLARSQEEHLDRPRPRDAGRARSLEPSPVGCRGSVDSTITAAGRCNKMAIIGGWISSPYGPYCDRSRVGILETLPFRSGFA
jgi:hypothetical protein